MDFDYVDHFKILKSARSAVFAGRQVDGRAKHFFEISDIYPYFGVPWKQRHIHKNDYGVVKIEEDSDHKGRKIARITLKRADDVTRLRDSYTMTYDSKEPFHNRVKIDIKMKSGFAVADENIKGLCRGCHSGDGKRGVGYHKIHSSLMNTW